MKKLYFKRIICLLCALLLALAAFGSSALAYSVGDDYPEKYKNAARRSLIDEWRFYNRECVSFTAWALNSRNGVAFTNFYGGAQWGNARNWGAAARSIGIPVDMDPAVGSVYWTLGPYAGGHVAWVAEVPGDGSVVIEEYNNNGDGAFHRKSVKASSADGYIHIKDIGEDYAVSPQMAALAREMEAEEASYREALSEGRALFRDVRAEDWYFEAVSFMLSEGLMGGISSELFGASEPASRAALAAILFRLEGSPELSEKTSPADVAEGSWYEPAVSWAIAADIASGNERGEFMPEEALTREQLAAMLYRYMDFKGRLEATGVEGPDSAGAEWLDSEEASPSEALSAFSDADELSPWAEDALSWAVENGILSGGTAGLLRPSAYASRAELATVFTRLAAL